VPRRCGPKPVRFRQKPLPVVHHGVRLDCGYRIDLLVEDVVLVELKAV
jgi:GxxExxY protein